MKLQKFEMKKIHHIETDYISIPVLAKKTGHSVADLLMAIHDYQIPVCIKLPVRMAEKLTEEYRSNEIKDPTKNLLPDPSSFPNELPPCVCIPVDRNVVERIVACPEFPHRVFQVCTLENGKFVAYNVHHIKLHMFKAFAILLKEHANQLLKILSKGTAFDDPLTMRERGNMLRTVGALVDILLQSHAGGGTEEAVIRDILDTYPNMPGLSRSNLQKIFAQSKRALECEEQPNPIYLP
jgi:hypothetical protein